MAAPEMTAAGLTIQTFDEAFASLAAQVRDALGQQVAADSPTSVIGIIDGIVAQLSSLVQEGVEGIYLNQTLDGAAGNPLDRLLALGGVYRKPATQSRVTVRFTNTGLSNVNVPAGSLLQITGTQYQFVTPSLFTAPASAYVDVQCKAVATGPTPVNSGQSWQWVSSFTGSTSVLLSNPTSGTTGTNVEDDAAFKLRFVESFSLPGSATVDAIRAAVLSVQDVQECAVFENDSDFTGILTPVVVPGLPPHSFVAVVKGTAPDLSVCQTIFARKPIGIRSWGATTESVTDSQGYLHPVSFEPATAQDIYVTAHVTGAASLSSLTGTIATQITAYINGDTTATPPVLPLGIAKPVLFNRIYAIVSDTCKNAGTPADDITVTLGTSPSPVGTSNVSVDWNKFANAATITVTAN